jgi:DNA ligase-associated metallophosphoesterase
MTPIPHTTEIDFAGTRLLLHPERAVIWPARKSVVIADLHLGKAASFRTAGVPVPAGTTSADVARLEGILSASGAARLVILGDFLHSRAGRQREVFDTVQRWRESRRQLEILLVRGNHDRGAGAPPAEWGIQQVEEPFEDGGFVLSHTPDCKAARPVLAGHIHPVYSLRDYDGSTVRAGCFVVDSEPECLVLPSFGRFTGGHSVHTRPLRKLFITTGTRIVRVE